MRTERPSFCPACAEITAHVFHARVLVPAVGGGLIALALAVAAGAWSVAGTFALVLGAPFAWGGVVLLARERHRRFDLACVRCRERELRRLAAEATRPGGSHRILDVGQ